MRIMVVHPGPQFSVHDVYLGVCEGLEANGVTVIRFPFDRRLDFYAQAEIGGKHAFDAEEAVFLAAEGLLAQVMRSWPDVIIVIAGMLLPESHLRVLRARRIPVVLWDTEAPYELGRLVSQAAHVDAVVCADMVGVDALRAAGHRVIWVPHGFRPQVHRPGPPVAELRGDVGFVGTGYPSRIGLLETVDWDGVELRLGGNWQALNEGSPLRDALVHPIDHCMDNVDTVRLYRSVKLSLNMYRRECDGGGHADGWAASPREIEMAATGLFFLREPRPESDALFGQCLPVIKDLSDQIRWWLAHPERRWTAASIARRAVADRTFTHTTARFLRAIEEV